MSHIAENLEVVRGRVAEAAKRRGRHVDLLVVSKTWPSEIVREAVEAGQVLFGENRLQEGEEKIPNLPDDLEWHFIGGLQRNKIRRVLPLFPVIHSISSMKLASFTNRVAGELGLVPKIYLEVNIGAEESKHGFSPEELRAGLEEVLELTNLDWQGLMCIPPRSETPEAARVWFAKVRELQSELELTSGRKLPGLSMGMSGDFEVAIEEGSTIVRVGSAIFGPRIQQP
ncbi:YggS family pyridoxal phosphate-dependent enzyme [Akkermansiaceae bacterium]|jgi:pyridoxal phosphate enzyme (YggS family)|nr:YggS family pyridoxal phosphate-dependent enzyme [Akkermansiaceae bacterium]MDB4382953.1 YggS family pyridoxal phosphate-dependent enzyme [Akkermansiaceae bacterium]MDB4422379.1 YggS family pyridoxal phosphate-dependent enzyme [bacterium]MDB4809401.1 YggS family pyridoxal phosphate-dependent enzyme [bacterium]